MDDLALDTALEARLTALESRAPARDDPPALDRRSRRGRFAASIALAPVMVLALVATAAAGTVVISQMTAEGRPGIENPGQPLFGAGMECMTPRDAGAFLTSRGYTDVIWQVESGTVLASDGGKGSSTTSQQASPPEHGYVIPGSVDGDGRLLMVIDQRTGATGVGDCFGQPMP